MSVGYYLGFLVGILYFQVLLFKLFWVNFCVLYKWSSFIPLHGCPVAPKACIKETVNSLLYIPFLNFYFVLYILDFFVVN